MDWPGIPGSQTRTRRNGLSVKMRADKVARNADSSKPVRTPPFDKSTIKPHKHGTGFSSCAACTEAGTASTCAHVEDWVKEA
ncbi:MAG TPA: hypothetical protein VMZ00_10015 [Sporichthya sp.]|nr:hypothetical protein [Sporichthya sp.]